MDLATREGIPSGHLMHHGDAMDYPNHSADDLDEAEKGQPNGMNNNHSSSNNGVDKSSNKHLANEEAPGRNRYLSKEYKVHWREKERIQKALNKENELDKDFLQREKEWLELEEQIKNDTYKEWNKLQQIKKKDIAKLIEFDLKGEQENANLSSSKKREMRNSKRKKEKELDDLDRLNEIREAEEEAKRRKEQVDRDVDGDADKNEPHGGDNQATTKSDQLPEDANDKANNQQESKDTASVSKSKSSFFMNALSFVFDRRSEGKVEEKGDEALDGEAAGGEESSETANENGQAKAGCNTENETVENDHADNASLHTTCVENDIVENCTGEQAEDTHPVETRTRKRKTPASEPINIKVNEKKKKKKTQTRTSRQECPPGKPYKTYSTRTMKMICSEGKRGRPMPRRVEKVKTRRKW
ncbi:hypothetical protein AK88_01461 [Plasmodium fragile]|uniref:Uncharacterized protein n=1 Tax=Plasmodium fragile TaxID=5857 RepID=A0A0D9QQ89_PLAFR|nr:uncharacterized protein AK88_01461 [Plasmodium fragile]KJP88967.1 hypothetical protein AK88_01461 [Plasmodium fragile]